MADTAPTAVEDMEPIDAKEDGPIETDGPSDPFFTNDTNDTNEPPTTSSNAGYVATSSIIPKKQVNRMDDKENKPLLANPIPIGKVKDKDSNRARFIALIVIIILIITGFLIAYFLWINPSNNNNNNNGDDDLVIVSTFEPTYDPTYDPTMNPSIFISTISPTTSTMISTSSSSVEPTTEPTMEPTIEPTLEPTQSNDSSSTMDERIIIGVSIGGGLAVLCILCIFCYCCCCKDDNCKDKDDEKKQNGYDEIQNDGGESELAVHTTV
mmetsp:Transcript_39835/g.35190  ORF Transcript_39835/g.35190 Transcript_39835/m.35190 type:complete len:267 (+) Transcript_39835:94-894(+)